MEINILALGDVVGQTGLAFLKERLKSYQKEKTISFPYQSLDFTCLSAAEQKQNVFLIRVQMQLTANDHCKSI